MVSTYTILKARWSEALLVVGLDTAGYFALMQVFDQGHGAQAVAPIAALLAVFFMVISKLLLFGFMRTAFVDGAIPFEPAALVKIGYNFFWRMVGFEIIIGALVMTLSMVLLLLTEYLFYHGADVAKIPVERVGLCFVLGSYLLLKPTLLAPASMIVWNSGIGDSFARLSLYRLKSALPMILAFTILQAWRAGMVFLPELDKYSNTMQYVVICVSSFVAASITLVAYLCAVQVAGEKYFSIEQAIAPQRNDDSDNLRKEEVEKQP